MPALCCRPRRPHCCIWLLSEGPGGSLLETARRCPSITHRRLPRSYHGTRAVPIIVERRWRHTIRYWLTIIWPDGHRWRSSCPRIDSLRWRIGSAIWKRRCRVVRPYPRPNHAIHVWLSGCYAVCPIISWRHVSNRCRRPLPHRHCVWSLCRRAHAWAAIVHHVCRLSRHSLRSSRRRRTSEDVMERSISLMVG